MNKTTVQYYDHSAAILVERYESARMMEIHNFLLRHIPCGKRVLEIGCGSGRDAAFLLSKGYQVTAIDPSSKMVAEAIQRHPELQGHLYCSGMPLSDDNPLLNGTFDTVLAIATIMHITDSDLVKSASQIRDMTSPDGLLILSSSVGRKDVIESRDSCGRLFLERSGITIQGLLEPCGFQMIELSENKDALKRDLTWINMVMKRRP